MRSPSLGPFRGVLFDVDGTLADSVSLFYEMSLDVFREAEIPPPPRERVYALMSEGSNNPWPELFPPDYPDVDAVVARVLTKRREEWMRRYYEDTQPLAGGVELVEHLAKRGYLLGIVTSSGRDLPFLERWGIRERFDAVVGREDVEQRKPHPEPIERCLTALRIEARDAVYVGDSRIDIRAARAAGVRSVGVTTGTATSEGLREEGADLVVSSLVELHDHLHPQDDRLT